MDNLRSIEENEKELLFKLGGLFRDSLDEFSTSVDRSLKYLDKITLPVIMASKNDKSYNPFSEIIEKYVLHILTRKFEKEGYSLLPLSYSADLTLENDKHILSIDIKTANICNPSDFSDTIPIGVNQMTHVAQIKLGGKFLPSPYFVYPTLPPFYKLKDGSEKLILTYGLMFIYPSYKDILGNIKYKYVELFNFFNCKVKKILTSIIERNSHVSRNNALNSLHDKNKLITENLIRGIFIHDQEKNNILKSLDISEDEHAVIDEFSDLLKDVVYQLQERDIKPIAIVAISLPNGLLKDVYLDKFVSGKQYAKSARYHYKDGIFEIIKRETREEVPRVIFIDLNEDYLDELKKYFDKITMLDYTLKVL